MEVLSSQLVVLFIVNFYVMSGGRTLAKHSASDCLVFSDQFDCRGLSHLAASNIHQNSLGHQASIFYKY